MVALFALVCGKLEQHFQQQFEDAWQGRTAFQTNPHPRSKPDLFMEEKKAIEKAMAMRRRPRPKVLPDKTLEQELIEKRNHPAMVHKVKSFHDLNFMDFSDIRFDVIVLKIPFENKDWGIDQFLNTIRLDFITDSPSFIVLGCGSTI